MDGLVRFCGEISLLCGEIQQCPRRHRCLPFSMKTYSESHDHENDYMKADNIFQRPLFRIFSRFILRCSTGLTGLKSMVS